MKIYRYLLMLQIALIAIACKNRTINATEQTLAAETLVTVDTVRQLIMTESANLNATAAFLQKNIVKANAAGYLKAVNVHVGQYVPVGTILFKVETKEARSIGNTINRLDPSFRFTGINSIRASKPGYVSQMNHQLGDYVQDGEQLGIITDKNSFAFLLNVPFELHSYVVPCKDVIIKLPDKTILSGHISSILPTVDSQSQAQIYVVRADTAIEIPENLIAAVQVLKAEKKDALAVQKSAILTNDTQTDYWVMKMVNSNTAVKVNVRKGMEDMDHVEIISDSIKPGDIVLASGNFGLPDTARVKITNR